MQRIANRLIGSFRFRQGCIIACANRDDNRFIGCLGVEQADIAGAGHLGAGFVGEMGARWQAPCNPVITRGDFG